ncbi:two-component system, sensor histidine kinase YesM [Paenibacillus algorifonticola]|uniref:Two-component system, sensor histidine kinase YesM n=1 Tax=Paenibacillus algorifonticola TaxID=684063 RepID=A0A1I2DIR3_9BACL|nr:sensor histidine kinase [Paenibacillus algorifonticola]SFE80367.1 two-component system, sensor histidine kinase YesM [Paenibacillus algorifonticola]
MNRKFGKNQFQASLQTKFFLTFVVLLLIVLGSFLVYVNLIVIQPLKEKTENEKLMSAEKVSDQLDIYIDSQNQLSQRILSNKDIFIMLTDDAASQTFEGLSRSRKLKDIMFQAIGPSLNIQDMIIYNLEGSVIASYIGYDMTPPSLKPLLELGETSEIWSRKGYLLQREQTGRVSFIRPIMNQNGEIFGYLSIQLDQAYLEMPAEGLADSEVFVLGQDGQLISSSKNAVVEKTLPALEPRSGASGMYMDEQQNYITYYQSGSSDWTTYIVTPKQAVLGPVSSIRNISILLITSLMLFSFFYIYFSAKNLLLPIRKLRSQILRVNYSNMNVKVDSRSHNNELILLNEAFQELLERLQQSIEREKLALHEEIKARNSALQAQIAPHFIHNVLYLISIAAQEGKDQVVQDMCKQLSDSLRYVVSSPYQHVSLSDELAYTRNYLSLVQQKYEDDLEWDIESDDITGLIQLPRLVIQPFVENCIEHAFKNTDPPWRISIRFKLYNGLWAIEISDNGEGFADDKIKEILGNIHDSDSGALELQTNSTGIGNMGMVNTVNRLKLMYKNRLFFNVYNNADTGKGATIQIIASLTKDFY